MRRGKTDSGANEIGRIERGGNSLSLAIGDLDAKLAFDADQKFYRIEPHWSVLREAAERQRTHDAISVRRAPPGSVSSWDPSKGQWQNILKVARYILEALLWDFD